MMVEKKSDVVSSSLIVTGDMASYLAKRKESYSQRMNGIKVR